PRCRRARASATAGGASTRAPPAPTVTPTVAPETADTPSSHTAPPAPAAGIVSTHATTMRRTTSQRTTPPARPRPAPMIPPETVCVVEREKPKYDEARMVVE